MAKPATTTAAIAGPAAPPPPAERVGAIRDRLDQIRELQKEIEKAPVDRAEVERRVDATLDALAAKARAAMFPPGLLSANGREITGALETLAIGELAHDPNFISGRYAPAVPWIAYEALTGRPALRQALLDAAGDRLARHPAEALSAHDRSAKLAALRAEQIKLEVEEVDLLWAIDEAGAAAPWRADLDAGLLLGLTDHPSDGDDQ